jgi:hypothetical protein
MMYDFLIFVGNVLESFLGTSLGPEQHHSYHWPGGFRVLHFNHRREESKLYRLGEAVPTDSPMLPTSFSRVSATA